MFLNDFVFIPVIIDEKYVTYDFGGTGIMFTKIVEDVPGRFNVFRSFITIYYAMMITK